MTRGKRFAVIAAALVAMAAGAVLVFRSPSEPPEPATAAPSAAPAEPQPAVPAPPTAEPDGAVGSTFASDQLDAKQRSELELVARLSGELELSPPERAAVEAALKKLQAGRHAQFARLIDGSADEDEVTAGLVAHHRAFEADIQAALGAQRATEFKNRFNAAYGKTFKKK